MTHVDYSARVQTVDRDDNPAYYDLIRRSSSAPAARSLVNTSFNVRGEPIVCTPEDAYRCFMRTNIDYLVLWPFLLRQDGAAGMAGGGGLATSKSRSTEPARRPASSRLTLAARVRRARRHRVVAASPRLLLVSRRAGAGSCLLGGLLVPGKLGPVYRAWMGLAHVISKVTTPIFMGVVYFLVITPIAVLRRTFGGNPLRPASGRRPAGWTAQQAPRGDLTRQF